MVVGKSQKLIATGPRDMKVYLREFVTIFPVLQYLKWNIGWDKIICIIGKY